MSRYLEIAVDGTLERVAERAHRAFRAVGRVATHDPQSCVAGTIRVDGIPASVTVAWVPAGDRIKLDIAATSHDTLSKAADSALYRFARSYKDVGWPEENPPTNLRPTLLIALGVLGMAIALIFGVTLFLHAR
jgi:hypothetical protein